MSSTRIEALIDEVQAAFDRRPTDIEAGLDVEDAALLQLRKACRLLAGAEALRDASYYTLVIEASLSQLNAPSNFGSSSAAARCSRMISPVPTLVSIGRLQQPVSSGSRWPRTLADLWRDHRAKTYYQDGLASAGRADAMYELATELHAYVTGRSRQGHECICGETT